MLKFDTGREALKYYRDALRSDFTVQDISPLKSTYFLEFGLKKECLPSSIDAIYFDGPDIVFSINTSDYNVAREVRHWTRNGLYPMRKLSGKGFELFDDEYEFIASFGRTRYLITQDRLGDFIDAMQEYSPKPIRMHKRNRRLTI